MFVLYVDLIKVFDRLVREFVLGLKPEALENPKQYFLQIGISEVAVVFLSQTNWFRKGRCLNNGPSTQLSATCASTFMRTRGFAMGD